MYLTTHWRHFIQACDSTHERGCAVSGGLRNAKGSSRPAWRDRWRRDNGGGFVNLVNFKKFVTMLQENLICLLFLLLVFLLLLLLPFLLLLRHFNSFIIIIIFSIQLDKKQTKLSNVSVYLNIALSLEYNSTLHWQ